MQPGNYTAHALDFFLNTPEGKAHPRIYPRSVTGMMMALDAMQAGQKFLMPEYGRVFAPGTRRGDFRDLLRLPYPVCVLEYFCPELNKRDADNVRLSDFFPKRRIAILLDTGQLPEFKGTSSDNTIMVVGCCEVEDGFWTFLPGAAILNPDTVDVNPETGLFSIIPAPFIEEAWDRPNYTFEEKVFDIGDEATAAVEFMMTINCENVKRERIEPSAKLNRKREANGKLPFSSYWVLDVFKEQRERGAGQGGSHASPRMHFRRGHIRRLASGKTTFVRHTMVGSGEAGVVQKTYNLKGAHHG
jgi:hypothetical protein